MGPRRPEEQEDMTFESGMSGTRATMKKKRKRRRRRHGD